jgi:cytoskeletal protein CcmA (bactofilin family)
MSRPPFAPVTNTPASTPMPPARPGITTSRPPVRDPADRRTLVVGRGISVQGTVQDAERLVVEGTVESTMIHATELEIAPGGIFKGEIEVEDVEVAGTIDGTLTARGSLTVRGSGRVLGTARCRRLQVEDGGQITGRIEMISDTPPTDIPPRQSTEPVASSVPSDARS